MLSPRLADAPAAQRGPGEQASQEQSLRWTPLPLGLADLRLPRQDALLFLKDFFTSLVAGINPMVAAETSAEGERLSRDWRARSSRLPPPSRAWAHSPSVSPTLARPDPRVQPSSLQEGQPEDAEVTGSREAAGGGHGSPAEQQPIYFR